MFRACIHNFIGFGTEFKAKYWRLFTITITCIGMLGCDDGRRQSESAATMQMHNFQVGAKKLIKDCGRDQLNSSNLFTAFVVNPGWPGWNGPYFDRIPTDPWET